MPRVALFPVPRRARHGSTGRRAGDSHAFDTEGVDTVVLGVNDRAELAHCREAEAVAGRRPDLRSRIDGVGLINAGAPINAGALINA